MKKFLLFLSVIFISVSFVRAQNDEILINNNQFQMPNIKFFLPIKPESWTISLISSGGFAGGTRLLVALNSNGKVMCSADETTFQNRTAPTDQFQEISDLITDEIPYLSFNSLQPPPRQIAFCSDCTTETLAIDYRDKKSILTDYFEVGKFTKSARKIKEIYAKLNELDVCN